MALASNNSVPVTAIATTTKISVNAAVKGTATDIKYKMATITPHSSMVASLIMIITKPCTLQCSITGQVDISPDDPAVGIIGIADLENIPLLRRQHMVLS